MKYKKYRDLLIDPFKINFKTFELIKILNYMPAGNDVIECLARFNNNEKIVFIKIERSKMACFETEVSNIKKLKDNNLYSLMPNVLEYGTIDNKRYIVLSKIEGRRLSEIITNNNNENKRKRYLIKYGMELSLIHKINCSYFKEAKQRIINDIPNSKDYKIEDSFIIKCINYLAKERPLLKKDTFIHGDFHYANILWKNKKINGVLDFEYSGKGVKEQDIAWSVVLRPGQKFLDNINDINYFLKGYKLNGNYDEKILKWCLINAFCHFYLMNIKNKEYINKIKKLIKIILNNDVL